MDLQKFKYVINEELSKFLSEYSKGGDVDWELYERRDEMLFSILHDFLYNNTPNFDKHIPWRLIKFPMLKKVWEEYMRYGFLRSTKPLDTIEGIIISNVLKLDILTTLAGHTPYSPKEDFDDGFGPVIEAYLEWKKWKTQKIDKQQLQIDYEGGTDKGIHYPKKEYVPSSNEKKVFDFFDKEIKNELKVDSIEDIKPNERYKILMDLLEKRFFWYYIVDPKSGQSFISDYGLEPLMKLVERLRNLPEDQIGQRITTIDKILNVVHQRSDLAGWFVEGGSEALSNLSASPSEREKENSEK